MKRWGGVRKLHNEGITGVSDIIHRPDFNNYKKKNKHDVSETVKGMKQYVVRGEFGSPFGPVLYLS
jgi:hypothetical protein